MKIIGGKIDVTKIDKSRLFRGEKGTYLNFSIILKDEKDHYGYDGFVVQDITKEEREEGKQGAILGNVKIVYENEVEKDDKKETNQLTDDIPF